MITEFQLQLQLDNLREPRDLRLRLVRHLLALLALAARPGFGIGSEPYGYRLLKNDQVLLHNAEDRYLGTTTKSSLRGLVSFPSFFGEESSNGADTLINGSLRYLEWLAGHHMSAIWAVDEEFVHALNLVIEDVNLLLSIRYLNEP